MEKEKFVILNQETGDIVPLDKTLLDSIKKHIIEAVINSLEQDRQQALRPDFLKALVVKSPENGGNGSRKRG